MGLRGDVGDGTDLEARGLQGADSGFTTGTRALDEHVDLLDTVLHRLAGGGLGSHTSGVRSGLTGALETDVATGCPGHHGARRIGDRDDRVVESGLDVSLADRDRLAVRRRGLRAACLGAAIDPRFLVTNLFVDVRTMGWNSSRGSEHATYYLVAFFFPATVRFGPLRVRALVLVR